MLDLIALFVSKSFQATLADTGLNPSIIGDICVGEQLSVPMTTEITHPL